MLDYSPKSGLGPVFVKPVQKMIRFSQVLLKFGSGFSLILGFFCTENKVDTPEWIMKSSSWLSHLIASLARTPECRKRHSELCQYFTIYGWCRFANKCSFLHFSLSIGRGGDHTTRDGIQEVVHAMGEVKNEIETLRLEVDML